jgi:transposase
MTHDYQRNGTTTLFAALNVLEGKVIGQCMKRHRHQEFIRFLNRLNREFLAPQELHLIMDNYGTHTKDKVEEWLVQHPRFHFHFTPTSSSWLNLVERWFAQLTNQRLRRGSFHSVGELTAAIKEFIQQNNREPKPFVWTATVEKIMEKVSKCKAIYETLH